MKLQFKVQQYQTEAVDAVVDVFTGQPYADGVKYRIDPGKDAAQTLLEDAGLQNNERGGLTVNEFCQTEVPNIYAIGDVNGLAQLAHAATSRSVPGWRHVRRGARE